MNMNKLRPLDLNKLSGEKPTIISSSDALKDVTPIKWSEDVISGKKKVTISRNR